MQIRWKAGTIWQNTLVLIYQYFFVNPTVGLIFLYEYETIQYWWHSWKPHDLMIWMSDERGSTRKPLFFIFCWLKKTKTHRKNSSSSFSLPRSLHPTMRKCSNKILFYFKLLLLISHLISLPLHPFANKRPTDYHLFWKFWILLWCIWFSKNWPILLR